MSTETQTRVRKRAVLFVDYQNMYRSARDAFGWRAGPAHFGNFRPLALGLHVTRDPRVELAQVRVYTGIHTPNQKPALNAMMQRRLSAWVAEAPDLIEVFPRPLRYSANYPQGQEKGVDVELAIDLVALALDDEFDVVVLGSADSDLVPALQFVADRFEGKEIVTLGYKEEPGFESDAPAALDLPRGRVDRRLINKTQFEPMIDRRNFFQEQTDESRRIEAERWGRIRSRYGAP